MRHLAQLVGMGSRGDAQQQSVEILLQSEEVELRGVGEQTTIIIVYVAVNLVIGGIDAPYTLQQLHLREGVEGFEHANGLFGGGLVAVDGQGGVDNFLHAATDAAGIVQGDGVADVEVDVVAVGHGDVDRHLAPFVEVVDSLAEHEEERAGVGP